MSDSEQDMMIPDADGNGETAVSLSEKDIEIIDFINDSLLESETKAKEELKGVISDKFGEDGLKVFRQLDGDFTDHEEEPECTDCGEMSEGWVEDMNVKMELFDIFIDDTYDEVAEELIHQFAGIEGPYPNHVITETVIDLEGDADPEKIKKLIDVLKKKILFHGITEGWLIDEHFVEEVK